MTDLNSTPPNFIVKGDTFNFSQLLEANIPLTTKDGEMVAPGDLHIIGDIFTVTGVNGETITATQSDGNFGAADGQEIQFSIVDMENFDLVGGADFERTNDQRPGERRPGGRSAVPRVA